MTQINTNPKKIDEILNRGTIVEILPTKKEFREKLLSGKKLKFYIGFDATAPTLHLSHAKNFMLMEKFRKLGHEAIILFGDFTARIGDPTGENSARKQLSRGDVIQNVKKWKELIEPLMDFRDKKNPPKIMYNNDWLAKLNLEDVINLASNFTVQQMLERDMFEKRMKENKPIHLHEFLYPLMQGYDSVAMDIDVEVCGTDQTFNALAGRTLLKKLKGKDKFVVTVTLMENPKTKELMSKSKGTGVFLNTSANDMFGQIMAQPDEMIEILFVNNTFLSLEEIKKLMDLNNPRDTKVKLAREIITIYHNKKSAEKAEEEFNKIHRDKEKPSEIKSYRIKCETGRFDLTRRDVEFKHEKKQTTNASYKIVDLLVEIKLASSKSEARRLVQQGGVKIDDVVQKDFDENIEVKNGMIVQVGKRRFVKIEI